jgi:prepilin-type N-terminal cleavage/methylation domain-containing protein
MRPGTLLFVRDLPRKGFSLLEVMVAVALLSLGLVLLLQVQARSIALAQEARDLTVGTMLLRMKLIECEADLAKKGFSVGDYNEEGNFSDDDFPTFFWECHGYKPDMPVADAGDISAALGGLGGPTQEAAGDAMPAGADMGVGMISPILSQMSSVLGDSIRELHVIVRFGAGVDMQELTATTHLIDKTAVNNIAALLAQQCRVPGAPAANPSGGNGDDASRGGGRGNNPSNPRPTSPLFPGMPGGGGGGKG